MTKKSKTLWTISGVAIVLVFVMLKFQCHSVVPPPKVTDSAFQVAKYKKAELEQEIKAQTDTQIIYKDRWRTKIIKGDSIFVHIYETSPDTCKEYIQKINKARIDERISANAVIRVDSLIIVAQDSLNKVNTVLINKYKGDITTLSDSIKKVKRRNYWKGLKQGFIAGAVVTQIVNIVEK